MFTKPQYYSTKYGKFIQYLLIYFFIRPYYKLFFNLRTVGEENIPPGKSVIFASSHASYHDPTLLAAAVKDSIAFMAKKELFEIPFVSQFITVLGAFAVNRQKLDKSTIKTAKHIITTIKWHLGIFPHGTRVKNGLEGEVKPGFSHLAKLTKAPILPVYIDLKKGKIPFYGDALVKIGKPLPYSDDIEVIAEQWRAAIYELAGKTQEISSEN